MIDFDYIKFRIKDIWGKIRQWFAFSTNRYYFRFLRDAFLTVPFDFQDIYTVQKSHLEFMLNYMEKRLYTTDDVYDEIIKYLKLAISLNEIASGAREDLYHFDGNVEYKDLDNGFTQVLMDNLVYHCDVYVNTKNLGRYINLNNKDKVDGYMRNKHEIYKLKARTLYFKILAEHIDRWWD